MMRVIPSNRVVNRIVIRDLDSVSRFADNAFREARKIAGKWEDENLALKERTGHTLVDAYFDDGTQAVNLGILSDNPGVIREILSSERFRENLSRLAHNVPVRVALYGNPDVKLENGMQYYLLNTDYAPAA